MRLLITGGAGCLGAALAEHYAGTAEAILALDDYATGHRGNLPDHGIEVVEGDVAEPGLMDALAARFRPTHVIHAAASYKDPADWAGDERVNVGGAIAVARAADAHGVRRLVNLQTVLCYGRPQTLPMTEDHPTRPVTSYGISKTAGEAYMLMASTPTVSLRLANVTGPRLAIGPIPAFYKRLKAGQPCRCSDASRDFLHMDDFLDAMDLVLAEGAPTGVFNIASGQTHSISEIHAAVARHLGLADLPPPPVVPVEDDDVKDVALDATRAAEMLGWRARRGFTQAMTDTLAWYDRHGVTAVFSHLKAKDPG